MILNFLGCGKCAETLGSSKQPCETARLTEVLGPYLGILKPSRNRLWSHQPHSPPLTPDISCITKSDLCPQAAVQSLPQNV